MPKPIIVLVLLVLSVSAGSGAGKPTAEEVRAEVAAVVMKGVEGWNQGDLEAFMAPYWQSGELRFASGGDVSHGWQAVLDRYRARYPDRKTMGRLIFSELDVRLLGEDSALAFGRWALEREEDRPSGLFTLVLRRFPFGWRIVHDHTSSE